MDFYGNPGYMIHWGIKGMRWGVRRYENPDGTLTAAGKKRYDRDVDANSRKKKENQVDPKKLQDPNRWVNEDLQRSKQVATDAQNISRNLADLERAIPQPKEKPRMDLSSMTDKELRDKINRELIERQYNNLFNSNENQKKGREYVKDVLAIAGAATGVVASSLGIALSIRALQGKA